MNKDRIRQVVVGVSGGLITKREAVILEALDLFEGRDAMNITAYGSSAVLKEDSHQAGPSNLILADSLPLPHVFSLLGKAITSFHSPPPPHLTLPDTLLPLL